MISYNILLFNQYIYIEHPDPQRFWLMDLGDNCDGAIPKIHP